MSRVFFYLILAGAAAGLSVRAAEMYDVAVYGGNAAAVVASVAASRNGAKTVLINPGRHWGGMVSGGLGVTDAGRVATIGGFSGEFFQRLGRHYKQKGPIFRHEPHVAEKTFLDMLAEAGVQTREDAALAEKGGVVMADGRIQELVLVSGERVRAKVFIDASYEGDLMAQAGVTYRVGREARETYGEELAGVRNLIRHGDRAMATDEAGVLPDLFEGDPGQPGAADQRIMSYNFRLCLTRDPDNQAPVRQPRDYDPRRYVLLSRVVLKAPRATFRSVFSIGELPNGKADFNNIGPISSNLLNASWRYPEASYAERQSIVADHRSYLQGLLYFLQNDPSVPEAIQREAREWAPARDEFADTEHWPHQLYVREARRMVGEKVMTQQDLQKTIEQPDSVGMGSYMMDSHYVQRVLSVDGLFSEGTLGGDHRVVPYEISYRSLVPQKTECTNLLVPVCLSTSHVALSSLRMEPVYMILAHSAGTAAALAAKEGRPVQEVDYAVLRKQLLKEGQVLAHKIEGQLDLAGLEGIVRDEGEASLRGNWLKSTSGEPFVGVGYIHDNNTDQGNRIATYRLPVPRAGNYEVRLYSAAGSNRSTRTKVTITADDGPHVLFVNQKELPEGALYRSLGVFSFRESATVEISNEGADGVVVADAVQLVPAEPAAGAVDDAEAVRTLRALIRRCQLPDGALRMSPTGETVRVVPYFSNIAVMALLSAGAHEDLDVVKKWLEWYAAHQEPDGTINDFSGTLASYGRTEHRDSTDSYAATFLQAVWRYSQAAGREAVTASLASAAEKAFAAIRLTLDASDGLTWAKPEYKAKYLMDNLEVCQGLTEGAKLFTLLGRKDLASEAEAARNRCARALADYWQGDLGHFAWAKGTSGDYHIKFTRWYPDGVIHLFALAVLQDSPPGLWAKLQSTFGGEEKLTPDWWLRASRTSGTPDEQERFRGEAVQFVRRLSESGQLNRFGTTLLALTETDETRTFVALPVTNPVTQ